MYCPNCGTENPEGAKICCNCSRVMTSAEPTTPSPQGRTSALAITSLVLGLLSCCTFFLTAPVAIILGIISLVMISKSQGQLKGIGMAIAGIAVPIVMLPIMAILMGILMPALSAVRITAQRVVCGSNMAALGKAMTIYANDSNGMYPTSSKWCDLLIEHADVNDGEFHCPAAFGHGGSNKVISGKLCSYAMNKNIEELGTKAPPDMVLLFESKPGWNQSGGLEILSTDNHQGRGCNILFNDGHAKFVPVEDINDLRWIARQ